MKPRYALRCARYCQDALGRFRDGDQWVHVYGLTRWVCASCADALAREAGIPTRAQVKRQVALRERKLQLSLDLAPETHSSARTQAG